MEMLPHTSMQLSRLTVPCLVRRTTVEVSLDFALCLAKWETEYGCGVPALCYKVP